MAKQVGPLFITGTIDGIIFYKLNGQYYMRSKGDYRSGKQMRKDPNLKRTMQRADQFGAASKLLRPLYYRLLPPEVRKHGLFGKLTAMVNSWLREGKTKEEAEELLIAHCQTLAPVEPATPASAERAIVKQLPASTSTEYITPVPSKKPVTLPPMRKTKNARYLSKWKVKRCGRLQVPKSDAVCLQLHPATKENDKVPMREEGRPVIPPLS